MYLLQGKKIPIRNKNKQRINAPRSPPHTHQELALLPHACDVREHGILEVGVRDRLLHARNVLLPVRVLRPRLDLVLGGDDYGDKHRVQRVAVDEHLGDIGALEVHVLDLLGRDVLALAQLEDVLLAVDNAQVSVHVPQPNVAAVQPLIRINDLRGLRGVLVVPWEHVGAAVAHLAPALAGHALIDDDAVAHVPPVNRVAHVVSHLHGAWRVGSARHE